MTGLVIPGSIVATVRDALERDVALQRRRGVPIDCELLLVLDGLRRAGSDEVPNPGVVSIDTSQWIRTNEAERRFGLSESYLRRLARTERVRRIRVDGKSWVFDPTSIEEYLCTRKRVA